MNSHFPVASWLAVAILWLGIVEAVSLPGCQLAAAPNQTVLNNVRTAQIDVPNDPFGLAYAPQGGIAFVALDRELNGSTLGVLNTSTFIPSLLYQIPLPAAYVFREGANGITVTNNGRYVLVSAGPGIIVVDAALAAAGSFNAVVGALNGTVGSQMPGTDALEVTVTPDGEYAFVSQEYGKYPNGTTPGNVDVFKLSSSSTNASISGTAVGSLTLGFAVVGTALSPDSRYLYAVSETTTVNDTTPGFLSTIDLPTLETNPSSATVISNVTAACGPVRTIVSSDGTVVWVTARESNHLLAFNASLLLSAPSDALLASVQVGTKPVGLTFARNETRILTADSNRSNYTGATSGLSVVDVQAALGSGGAQGVLGRIPTGLFPREVAVSPDGGTVLVSDYMSGQIQAVDVATIP